jgi:hypothetical protein
MFLVTNLLTNLLLSPLNIFELNQFIVTCVNLPPLINLSFFPALLSFIKFYTVTFYFYVGHLIYFITDPICRNNIGTINNTNDYYQLCMWYIDNQSFTTENNFKFLFLSAVLLINLYYNLKNIVLLPIPVRPYGNKNKNLCTIIRQISNNYPTLIFLLCLLGAILIIAGMDYYNKQVIASVRRAKSAQDELFVIKELKSNQSEYVSKIIKEAACGLQDIINHVDNTLCVLELIDYYNIVFVPWF